MAETAREGMGSHGAGSVLAPAALMSRLLSMVGVGPEELENMCAAGSLSIQGLIEPAVDCSKKQFVRRAAVYRISYVLSTLQWRSMSLAGDSSVQLWRLPGDDARCRS
jgi:hypothetical protein